MILIGLKENKIIITDVVLLFALFFANASDDVTRHQSKYSAEEIANRFEESAINKGMTIFTRIDHSQNAHKINLEL